MTTNITNMEKMRLFGFSAVAAALITAAPTLILSPPQLAQAQQGKVIEGAGRGQVNCPSVDGEPGTSPQGDETITFIASKQKGTLFGQWEIFGEFGGIKSFNINGGHIGGKEFTLRGTETFDQLCNSEQIPAAITITGECGTDVTIHFRASNGEEGEFVGNVACAK